jgi:glyoxylase-like metal-dependent hydrolase (beta-lactamase superfamily II)
VSGAGGTRQVAEGVWRISIPLPFPPFEVAAWLLEGDQGHLLVDTGIDTPQAREAFRAAAASLGVSPASLGEVVITHAHLDHYGLAGVVREWSGARLLIHAREEALARRFVDRWPDDRADAAAAFARLGVPAALVPAFLAASDTIHGFYAAFHPDQLLSGSRGELPGSGGWEWIHTPGHSPGHVVLHHPARRLLISGDHVLPRISPNIGADLYAEEPLSDYLASLRALGGLEVALVLPSHGEPFGDLQGRVQALLSHHDERNAAVLRLLEGGSRSTFEVAQGVWGDLPAANQLHAVREALAHLRYLERAGQVRAADGAHSEGWARA